MPLKCMKTMSNGNQCGNDSAPDSNYCSYHNGDRETTMRTLSYDKSESTISQNYDNGYENSNYSGSNSNDGEGRSDWFFESDSDCKSDKSFDDSYEKGWFSCNENAENTDSNEPDIDGDE